MNKKLKIGLWILSGVLLIVIIVFVSGSRSSAVCTKITVHISDSSKVKLISENEIKNIIETGDRKIINKPIREINLSEIEKRLNKYLFIKHAEVFMKIDGELVAEVTPRIPIVRVCNRLNQHYRIDKEGYLMPVSKNNPVRLLVANGNISHKPKFDTIVNIYDTCYDKRIDMKTLRDIHTIATFTTTHPFWDAQIQQIYINNSDELEFSTLVGDQIIQFGSIDNYKEKFRNLEVFYKKGMPAKGWNTYTMISVKYKNQVVCTKPGNTQDNGQNTN